MNSPFENGRIVGELQTLHHYPEYQFRQTEEDQPVKSGRLTSQQDFAALTPKLKLDLRQENFNRKKSTDQNSHSKSKKRQVNSSNSRLNKLNDRIIHNHN